MRYLAAVEEASRGVVWFFSALVALALKQILTEFLRMSGPPLMAVVAFVHRRRPERVLTKQHINVIKLKRKRNVWK